MHLNDQARAAIRFNGWYSAWKLNELDAEIPRLIYIMEDFSDAVGKYFSKFMNQSLENGADFRYGTYQYGKEIRIVARFNEPYRRQIRRLYHLFRNDLEVPKEFQEIRNLVSKIARTQPILIFHVVQTNDKIQDVRAGEKILKEVLDTFSQVEDLIDYIYAKYTPSELQDLTTKGKFLNIKDPKWTDDGFKCSSLRFVSYRRGR